MELELTLTPRQRAFVEADADEVLFGGAAGGGKSYAQLADALLYALRYPGSRQLILRRTYPDLERSLIAQHLALFPREVYSYVSSAHLGRFANGSLLEFGYCDHEKDVYRYQGAEYDVIRFDELTHFSEGMYRYLMSRLRGANRFPKHIKSSTNPGGVGHAWVKARFIDPAPAGRVWAAAGGTRLFLPSRVQDNPFLIQRDPGYLRRLENLPDAQRRALLNGEWDLFEGQFFAEFRRELHVCDPFFLPDHWPRYLTLDYGTDMLAAYWAAMDEEGRAWVYREVYEGRDNGKGEEGRGHTIGAAARLLRQAGQGESLRAALAPPDLWNRRQETGRSAADYFAEAGLPLTRTSNDRVNGWRAVREWLAPGQDGKPRLRIFANCRNLIRTLPALQFDPRRPEDAAREPHELTHAPDALRGFCVYWTGPARAPARHKAVWTPDQWEDYERADGAGRAYLIEKYGDPF